MIKQIVKKILINLIVLVVSFILIFFIINLLMQNQIKHNSNVSSAIQSNLFLRFFSYLKNVFNGSFGVIYSQSLQQTKLSIPSIFFSYFGLSMLFCFISFLFAFVIGNLLGILAAQKETSYTERSLTIVISVITAIPLIVLMVILLIFSSKIGYPSQYILNSKFTVFSLLVPIIICFIGTVSFFFFRTKKSYSDVLKSEHYLFYKTLGFSKMKLFTKVIFKSLVIDEIQYLFPVYLVLITISLAVERIFNIPGQSVLISFAYNRGEVDILMYFFIFSLLLVTISKTVFDILISFLNPEQVISDNKLLKFRRFKHA